MEAAILECGRLSPLTAKKTEEEARMMNYMYRWAMRGQALPAAIRGKIYSWAANQDTKFFRDFFAPIADAANQNNIKILFK